MNGSPAVRPPTPETVATRALVLGALCIRAFLEHVGRGEPAGAEAERIRLLQWLNSEGIADAVTPDETPVFETPTGDLTDEQTLQAAWRMESLAVLLWALGHRQSVPSYDEE